MEVGPNETAPMTEKDPAADETEMSVSWLLFRPRQLLMSLPVEHRWEFTRRHPYYLTYWQLAKRRHEQPSSDPTERMLEDGAVIILQSIGVAESAVPDDPHLGPEALGSHDFGGVWTSGAVAPAMLRTLAVILMGALPASQRGQLGALLSESEKYASQDDEQMTEIVRRLLRLPDDAWNSFPDIPFISINLEQSQRAITDAVEALVRQWKEQRNIAERRRRDDKLDLYLRAWDAREGWVGGEYDATREMTFQQIARETGDGIDTVISRYRTAFKYLSGHEYTPALWLRLMGPLKLSRYRGSQAGQGSVMHRPWRSPKPRPVAASVLLPGRKEYDGQGFLAAAGVTSSDIDLVEMMIDIETLVARGQSNSEIIDSLELSPAAVEQLGGLIDAIRERHEAR